MRPFKRGLVCGKVSVSEPQTKPRLNGSLFIALLEERWCRSLATVISTKTDRPFSMIKPGISAEFSTNLLKATQLDRQNLN